VNRRTFLRSVAASAIVTLPAYRGSVEARASGPADVLLMRHAEEPDHGPDLNDRGRDRSKALVRLFPQRFPTPTALFAARTTKESARSAQTLEPLAATLGLPVDDRFVDTRYAELALTLLSEPKYAGAHVLICWHRETMPALAAALGVERPPAWPSSRYDRVWFIRFAGTRAKLSEESQWLLADDR
jgi:phosphohistidine phosphatase SixA